MGWRYRLRGKHPKNLTELIDLSNREGLEVIEYHTIDKRNQKKQRQWLELEFHLKHPSTLEKRQETIKGKYFDFSKKKEYENYKKDLIDRIDKLIEPISRAPTIYRNKRS